MTSKAPATDVVVRLEHVTKRFGDTVAVDDLDLSILAGQFVTFLGPSGCGKSTTLRMLGGFERPDEGRILLDGEDVTHLPPNRRDVNMVFQDYALFPHLSVARNVAFGLELQGMGRDAIRGRVTELLAFLELDAFGERMPDELSGGQRQRVALARALARDPRLLLLDEPLGALDARLRAQVQLELKDIHGRTGKTFVFVTHDQEEALTMSDRIVVMNAGRVEQDGTPEELYLHPRSRFVAGFVGETNLFDATVVGTSGETVTVDWNGLRLAGTSRDFRPRDGQTVGAAIRPESLTPAVRPAAREAGADRSLPARVVDHLFKGSRTLATLEIGEPGSGNRLQAYLDPAMLSGTSDGRIRIEWRPESLSILP